MKIVPVKSLAMALKRATNVVVGPTWCEKCGTRLTEQQIGFREQGSRYACNNTHCPLCGATRLVLAG